MNIDIRQLRYFLAVADERSFTRGAERLNMAQPPLSKRIQELEAALGVTLFERGSRPLRLTPAGQLLYEQAHMIVRGMQQLQATMHRFVETRAPRFVFGLVPSTLYARLPEVIGRFRQIAPELDIGLSEMDSQEQMAALLDGRIDIGFDRVVIEEPSIQHIVARDEPLVVAVAKGHAFAQTGRPVDLAALCQLPLILYPREPRPSFADLVLSAFHARGLVPERVQEVRELQTALVMVAADLGVCIVPQSVRRHGRSDIAFLDIGETVMVPLIMRFRKHDGSVELRQLLALYVSLYREWGWPLSAGLLHAAGADAATGDGPPCPDDP
ncbi:LysR family transcriptional regulator [Sphingobium aquiterrae]|uniref:LysR family transcriptional regulator n=1 Tax=Sphingobium aquiterrae TaxID=2038656 RepID=UPI003016EFC8